VGREEGGKRCVESGANNVKKKHFQIKQKVWIVELTGRGSKEQVRVE